jgi:peroxiredoxin
MPEIGAPAPTFTLLDTARKPVSTADYAGRKLVVAFYPAAFTGVCTKELCTFRDSIANLEEIGAAVVAISVDAPFSNAAFATQNGINFPVLSDYDRAATNAYGVGLDNFAGMAGYRASQRSVFVIAADGTLAWAWVAPNPGVEPDYDAVKAAVAAA